MMTDAEQYHDDVDVPSGEDLDPVAAYRQSLSELIFNSKPHILMLTMLAEEAKDARAAEVVECIEQRLFQVKNDVKLPTLYLIDSIVKNVPNSPYIRMFQKRIIRMFIHTFEKADEKTRVLLFKLRSTWTNYFSHDVLYNLDLAVKKIDPGWPISKNDVTNTNQNGRLLSAKEVPKPGMIVTVESSPLPTKPAPVKKSNVATIKDSKLSSKGTAAPMIVMITPPELNSKRNQIEHELRKELTKMAGESIAEIGNSKVARNKRKMDDAVPPKLSPIKIKKMNEQTPSLQPKNDALKKSPKSKKSAVFKRKSPPSPTIHQPAGGGSSKLSKKTHQDEVILPAPDDVIPLGRDHHLSVAKRKDVRPVARVPDKINPMLKPGVVAKNRRRDSPVRNNRMSPTKGSERPSASPPSTVQTIIPAADVFVKPEVFFPSIPSDPFAPKPTQPTQTSNYVMDRDYRREFESVMRDAQNRLDAGTITMADHDLLIREAEKQFIELQKQPAAFQQQPQPFSAAAAPLPVGVPLNAPPPLQQPVMAPSVQNAPPVAFGGSHSTAIEPPYGSAPIFINKQLCRLFYLDHITGLVCFQSHPDTPFDQLVATNPTYLEPKQVYFSGHPTKVTIDPGCPNELSFCLKFNDPTPFLFTMVPGMQPQRVMLGLPDRELIVNDRPYKAQFGGQPTSVFMECDGQQHLFLLSDSRPFLQLSDKPCYDLWNRLVNEARAKCQGNNVAFNYGSATTPAAAAALPPNSIVTNPPLSGGMPLQPTSNDSFVPVPSVEVPKPILPNLDSLMSKLSEAGLLSKPAMQQQQQQQQAQQLSQQQQPPKPSKSNRKRKNRDRQRENREPPQQVQGERYLPLAMNQLKQQHKFVVDQLYAGVQCTNCSLRFPSEALQDEKGKKSRYSRHLDWHFRQNRREKAKPGSTSNATATAQRRPWFYTLDQWIQFKEVNDDVEEDGTGFFDSNNETGVDAENPLNQIEYDFSAFKDFISNFDRFMEAINCDTNNPNNNDGSDNNNKKKICSVTADSDQTSNCTVCNEPFDLKWFEEEEDWRLMNAVCYTPVDAEGEKQPSKNFHPLCLKDYLIQQLDKENSHLSEPNANLEIGNTKSSIIPGLDMPLKEEEDLPSDTKIEPDVNNEEMKDVEENQQVGPTTDEPTAVEQENDPVELKPEDRADIEIESFEVKVEEFEIPIETTTVQIRLDDGQQEANTIEQSVGSIESDPALASVTEKQEQPPQQPKRAGIVIKMKRSAVPSEPTNPTLANNSGVDHGNVSATSGDDSSNHSRDLGPATTVVDPTRGGIGNGDDDEDGKTKNDDDDSYNKGDSKDAINNTTPTASPGSDGLNDSSSIKHYDDDDRQLSSEVPGPSGFSNVDDDGDNDGDDDVAVPAATSAADNGDPVAVAGHDENDRMEEHTEPNLAVTTETENPIESTEQAIANSPDDSGDADAVDRMPQPDSTETEVATTSSDSNPDHYYSRGHEVSALCTIM